MSTFSFAKRAAVPGLLFSLLAAAPAWADDTSVIAAANGFYASVAKAQLSEIAHYIPADGIVEMTTVPDQIKTLQLKDFEGAFKAGVKLDFHLLDVQVHPAGNAEVLTGYREGTLTLPDGKVISSKQRISMVWVKGVTYHLFTIHLSQ